MTRNVFKYTDRGYKNTLVLIPGWACDYRIFDQVDLGFNYLLPEHFHPWTIVDDLAEEIDEHLIDVVDVLGFSLGGFEALRFASMYPEYTRRLILIGVRQRYPDDQIAMVKNNLKKNKKAGLTQFYKWCFYDRSKMTWFKENLMKDYCEDFSLDQLLETLDYLSECSINVSDLMKVADLTVLHGKEDIIAPVHEVEDLCKRSATKLKVFENTGHAVFLEQSLAL